MKALSVFLPNAITLLAYATSASASVLKSNKPKNAFFSGIETKGEIINPGRVETKGGNIFIQGMVHKAQDHTFDVRNQRELILDANAWLDPITSSGPMLGTFILENPGGKWLAAWIGQKKVQGFIVRSFRQNPYPYRPDCILRANND